MIKFGLVDVPRSHTLRLAFKCVLFGRGPSVEERVRNRSQCGRKCLLIHHLPLRIDLSCPDGLAAVLYFESAVP